ncbi:MAG: hypothetical protein IT532_05855 [Burkholderiales bacterium]|nr:hypothetical protein [Burkholderiales bacterium]
MLGGSLHVALAQQPSQPPQSPVTFGLEAAAQGTTEYHAFWGLAQEFSPSSGYAKSYTWLEAYAKPFMKGEWTMSPGLSAYGGASMLGSGTLDDDLFLQGNTGRVLLEDAYLGLRATSQSGLAVDASAGAQPYKLGQGLLLSVGAGNGFERGAAILSPRRAWEMTGIARASLHGFTVEAFYLDANELKSGDTGTKLAGGRFEWASRPDSALGAAYFKVLSSSAPYPKAPLVIIDSGRDGLESVDLYWRYEASAGPLAGFSFLGEAAFQRNDRIDMKAHGFGAEIGYRFGKLPFSPRISYSPRVFSGDDPGTSSLERFDSLFYDGAPDTWSSGGNGSFAFYNSNLVIHRIRLDLIISERDFVNLSYWNVHAEQANSPVQYGQAARLKITDSGPVLVTGFPERALSQEFYLEHTRVLSQHFFLTWGVAAAIPQSGVKALVSDAKTWWGGFVNVTCRF